MQMHIYSQTWSLLINRNTDQSCLWSYKIWLTQEPRLHVGVSLDITLPVCVSVCVHITHYLHGWAEWVVVVQARSTLHYRPACQWVNDRANAAISTYTLHLHHHVHDQQHSSLSSSISIVLSEGALYVGVLLAIGQSINQSINQVFLFFPHDTLIRCTSRNFSNACL